MNDIRSFIIMISGAFIALLSPIQDFMFGMLFLFALNFAFGWFADIFAGKEWSWRKAGMFFVYCLTFFVTAASMFVVGHFLHAEQQALVCVKYVCFAAVYLFGTNIVRNWRSLLRPDTPWHRLVSLLYYVLTVKFIEKFELFRHIEPETEEEQQ